ncbi:hypothetical protein KO02_10130 [Sphingobacterium sp. ML3W]|uniref:hypothetical protein n=1 Tax=Sphingobacterium sp. ML3W TaxID=1538644 RepID=UPI0004F64DFA|nr:hypothetical protein [Sphingobacterium sp. ML3W]AIM37012.1 hypothetical protein KO02_10130 [Sphingobacterium sp. ML3W]
MKKILIKINRVLQVVLMAPIKLPAKALNILKYIALGLGVVETVLEDKDEKESGAPPDEAGQLRAKEDGLPVSDMEDVSSSNVFSNEIDNVIDLNKEFTTGKEAIDETE